MLRTTRGQSQNLMLDEADKLGIKITPLSLQKLLYFAHGMYLIQTKSPLMSGYFEAWELGPVHPSAYRAFKAAGSAPIKFRAAAQDPLTGERRELQKPNDPTITGLVQQVINSSGHLAGAAFLIFPTRRIPHGHTSWTKRERMLHWACA